MRLAGAEKIGYYPTPEITLQQVANLLTVNNASSVRLLDPCAGEGEALAFVQNHLRTTTAATIASYGVEIAHNRIPFAEQALDQVLHSDWQDTAISHEAFGLLWLNPPYDTTIEEGKQRQEYLFLKGLYTRLQVGGVLVYIVPIGLLRQESVCKLLAAHFHSISVRRLCDEEFSLFKQLVIVGIRKPRVDPDPHMADYLHQFSMDNLPDVMEANAPARYTIPTIDVPNHKLIFRKQVLTYQDVLRQAPSQGAYHNRQLQDWLTPNSDTAFRPVVPLKTGHVGSLISSGQMGVINLQTVAAKGRATKVIEYFNAQGECVPSDDTSMVESRERFTTEVTTIDQVV